MHSHEKEDSSLPQPSRVGVNKPARSEGQTRIDRCAWQKGPHTHTHVGVAAAVSSSLPYLAAAWVVPSA